MNIRKAIQAQAFSFIVPNLVEKALLIMLEYTLYYIKSALRNKQLITFKMSLRGYNFISNNINQNSSIITF